MKFSGESVAGEEGIGIDPKILDSMAISIKSCKDLALAKFKRALPLYNVSSVTTQIQALSYPQDNTVDDQQSNIMYAGVVILKQVLRSKGFNPTTDFIIKTLEMGNDIEKSLHKMTDYHKVKTHQAFANFYALTIDKPEFIEALDALIQEEE